jgi:hypothetical protein
LSAAVETVSKRDLTNKQDGGVEYNPAKKKVLPKPPTQKPSSKKIVFSRALEEIKLISEFLFDRDDESPSVVGDKCFEIVLGDATAKEENK